MLFRWLQVFYLTIFISACGRLRSEPTLYSYPVEHASRNIKEIARSVVQIRSVENAFGTGFFITPKHILTNEHVVPRDRCNATGCQGIIAIRGFGLEGENQVFYQLKPIAQNVGLDFALLEVLDGSAPVEGLTFATKEEVENYAQTDDRLVVLGHPLSGPMKVSPARIRSIDEQQIELDAAIIFGNSGGPVVDKNIGQVVGLIFGIRQDMENYEIGSKTVPLYARATHISAIVEQIHKTYPETLKTLRQWRPTALKKPRDTPPVPFGQSEVLPLTAFNLLWLPYKFPQFLSSTLSRPTKAADKIEFLVNQVLNLKTPASERDSLLYNLVNADLARGQTSVVTSSLIRRVKKFSPSSQVAQRFVNFYDDSERLSCAKAFEQKDFTLVGTVCHLTRDSQGFDILSNLRDVVARSRDTAWGSEHGFHILKAVEAQLLLRDEPLHTAALSKVIPILESIRPLMARGMAKARWESLYTLWQTNPKLLMRGGFAPSFKHSP